MDIKLEGLTSVFGLDMSMLFMAALAGIGYWVYLSFRES